MFFCRHPDVVARAFSVRTAYMPGSVRETRDPYLSTVQWSRRFIGLKVFAALADLGAAGLADLIESQARTGDRLRALLEERGWRIVNATSLPVVCFTHPRIESGRTSVHAVERAVLESGEAWISSVRLGEPPLEALRACITSYRTGEEDLRALVRILERSLPV
jgi:glutamate/tyrosine decarboxylase-like PLP-dependent enzyme